MTIAKDTPKILTIDIETAPIEANVWGLFDQNVGLNQIKTDWSILSYSAKWLNEDRVMYGDTFERRNLRDDKAIVKTIWNLLNEADLVIGQNVVRFDRKKINARFFTHGLPPPSPYRMIDTMLAARQSFGFTSNKLEYLTDKFCKKHKKLKHKRFPGFELWAQYLARNPLARVEMREYNEVDVLSTEELYLLLRPWIRNHPNVNIYKPGLQSPTCPKCGSHKLKRKGFRTTNLGRYQRFICGGCGGWCHERQSILTKEDRINILGNGE